MIAITQVTSKLFLLCLLITVAQTQSPTPCPFNPHCQCLRDTNQVSTFLEASCYNVAAFPTFDSQAIQAGTIIKKLSIAGSFNALPHYGLDHFSRIDHLILEHTGDSQTIRIENDAESALRNCSIGNVDFVGFWSVLPLGTGFGAGIDGGTLGKLRTISIEKGQIMQLQTLPDPFKGANALEHLILRDDEIPDLRFASASPKLMPFHDIADTLLELDLGENHLESYPKWKPTLEELQKLQILSLDQNKFKVLRTANFSAFEHLRVLNLSGNPLSSLDSSLFPAAHPALEELYLNDLNLDRIPRELLQNLAKTLTTLHLANNHIQKLAAADLPFTLGNHLSSLVLTGNPIKEVELGTLKELRALYHFTIDNWAFETLDLSIFGTDRNGIGYLEVFNNANLTTIKLSDLTALPVALNRLYISGNRLKSIDKSISPLFGRNDFQLIISDESNFDCPYNQSNQLPSQELAWLAKLSICDRLVTISDNVLCASELHDSNSTAVVTFKEYLKTLEIDCDETSVVTGKTTVTPHVTTTEEAAVTYSFFGYFQGHISISKFISRFPQWLFGKPDDIDES